MTWTSPSVTVDDGPLTGAERPMLEAVLRWHRADLLNICAGLTGEQMAMRAVGPSRLSLLGLVRHMAKVERIWFIECALGQTLEPMYGAEMGKDADFEDIHPGEAPAAVERLQDMWRQADEAASGLELDYLLQDRHGETLSLRMVYLHMAAEYARHNGHADLLRESIDGVTGR